MSYSSRSVVLAVFVATVFASLSCGSKTITKGRAKAINAATADGGGANADDTCLVFSDDDKHQPGEICVCATDCTTGNCDQGVCCQGAACGAKRPNGAACFDSDQCTSGFCADGVCCNVACSGACLACNQPDMLGECAPVGAGVEDPHQVCRKDSPESCGQNGVCNGQGGCAKYSPDTTCNLESCDPSGQWVPPSSCDGEGTCVVAAAISCSPSKCIGNACARVCTNDNMCVTGKTCLGGSCGKFGPGQPCAQNSECDTNFCADGVCCESACTGACQSCSNPASRGKCVPAIAGASDPACPVTPASSCGTNGKCDGQGACATYDNNTVCRPAKCDAGGNMATLAAKCNNGSCPGVQTRSCAPFKGCNGNSCVGTCGSNTQCTGGAVCTAGSCGKRPNGGKCGNGGDCDSGICAQGVCCNSACNGVCKSCSLSGQQGTCSNVPSGGADPGGRCSDGCNNQCNGSGGCRHDPAGSSCGSRCDGNKFIESKCTAGGACQAGAGQTCSGMCTPNGCKDVCTPANEGSRCGGTGTCSGGLCCPAGTKKCGNACVNPEPNCAGKCGMVSNACGTKDCGGCEAGKACVKNACVGCAEPTCGLKCNTTSDPNACGKTIMCNGCAGGLVCMNNTCKKCVPTKACTPADCGKKIDDGCGKELTCPACGCVPKDPCANGQNCGKTLGDGCGKDVKCEPCACVPMNPCKGESTCGKTLGDGCGKDVKCEPCACVPMNPCKGESTCGKTLGDGCGKDVKCEPCACVPMNPCKGESTCGKTLGDGCGKDVKCEPCACVPMNPCKGESTCGKTLDDGCGKDVKCEACACVPKDPCKGESTCGKTLDDGCGKDVKCEACACVPKDPCKGESTCGKTLDDGCGKDVKCEACACVPKDPCKGDSTCGKTLDDGCGKDVKCEACACVPKNPCGNDDCGKTLDDGCGKDVKCPKCPDPDPPMAGNGGNGN